MQALSNELTLAAPTDQRAWMLFREGDREALGLLYHRYFKLLMQYGAGVTSDRALVRDCIHDIFVEIWNKKHNLAVPRSVKAYLIVSVRRKLLRMIRRERSAREDFDVLPDILLVESKEEQMIRDQSIADRQTIVRHAISKLTRRQREAIYLRFYADLSYAEITGIMKISSDAIYNLVSGALDALQRHVPALLR
jgi:RNA polymerase sigma factor (sigma-70 family)